MNVQLNFDYFYFLLLFGGQMEFGFRNLMVYKMPPPPSTLSGLFHIYFSLLNYFMLIKKRERET